MSTTRKAQSVSTPQSVNPSTSTNQTNSQNGETSVTVTDTQNVEQNVETNSAGNSEANVVRSPGELDPNFYELMYSQTVESVRQHNDLVTQAQQAGDRVSITDSLKDNPEQTNDDNFVSLAKRRQEISDALEEIEKQFAEAAKPFIDEQLKKSGAEEKLAKADEIAKKVKATTQFFTQMGASTEGIDSLKGKGKSATTGDGRGAGVRKYRHLEVWVNGKRAEIKMSKKNDDGTTTQYMASNLTQGALAANVPSDVFRAKFVEAQGSEDPANFKPRVEFKITGTDNVERDVLVKYDPNS